MYRIKISVLKQLSCLLFVFISHLTFSQNWSFEKPNYEKIKKEIKKKKSNLFYDTLMSRFLKGDSTMTLEEKRHLYYGYSHHKNYSPYGTSDYMDSLMVVLNKKEHDSLDLKKIHVFSDKVLKETPFNIRAINYQLYVSEETGDEDVFNIRLTQLKTIVDALMSSGNGKTKKEAFYVIYTAHEYDLINILGYQFGGSQSLIEHYDHLTLAKNDQGIEGLYFDVSPCFNAMMKVFKK